MMNHESIKGAEKTDEENGIIISRFDEVGL